jgi:hypothetical protein
LVAADVVRLAVWVRFNEVGVLTNALREGASVVEVVPAAVALAPEFLPLAHDFVETLLLVFEALDESSTSSFVLAAATPFLSAAAELLVEMVVFLVAAGDMV